MRKHIVRLLVCSAFVISAWGETAFGQTIIKAPTPVAQDVRTLQKAALAKFITNLFPESIKEASGMGNVNTNPATGEVWSLGMFGTPTGAPLADAGFKSNSLQNSGTTDWTGVTITAAFQLLKSDGWIIFYLGAEENTGSGWTACTEKQRHATGPLTQYATKPFTMKPGAKYRGTAWFSLDTYNDKVDPGKPIGCYAKITSIKFNFP